VTDYTVYKAISPCGKSYIGVTNNFKRRMREHSNAKTYFGNAVRKYGINNFHYEFEVFENLEDAFSREKELVTLESIQSGSLYNVAVGGRFSIVLLLQNPMHCSEIVRKHPTLWTTENNPMNNPECRAKMIKSQKRNPCRINGVMYESVREASRLLNTYRQLVTYRLKSLSFPDWCYV
jgi:predicted GIY-YIG superfamily endonuclease